MVALVAALVLLLVPAAVSADLGGFTIASFHADLTVRPDARVQVVERIEVDFSEPRHGLYRVIPVRYTDRLGAGYSLGFRLIGVEDDGGEGYRTRTTSEGRNVQIRIGDPEVTVTGRKVYVLRYTLEDALGRFPAHDELYWNVTGNEWGVPIARATAAIRLPHPLPADSVEAVGYAGAFGESRVEVSATVVEPGLIAFEALAPLAPFEGLTVDAVWPPGYVTHPGALTRAGRFVGDNLPIAFPLAWLLLLAARYRRSGRDPQGPAATVVRYEPPAGITPSELGTLMDEQVDLRDITAALVDLAVRGYLVIEVEKKELLFGIARRDETVFRRTDKAWDGLAAHESLILAGVFEHGTEVRASELRERFYRHLPGIRNALYGRLTQRGHFAEKPTSVRNRTMALGVGAAALTAIAGIGWVALRGGIFPPAAAVPVVSAVITAILFAGFARAMPRRTAAGVQVRAWGLGFQEFVDRVEKESLDAAEARNTFERLLPYAMALGIASRWARRFEGIYAAGGGPIWYTGAHPSSGFSTFALERSLSTSMADAGRSLTASPRSSGSGGGGFSGGGGGGGGGGSW